MSLIAVEYLCEEHGRFESIEERPPPDDKPCPTCFGPAPWCISAPLGTVKRASATQGRYEPPPVGYLDTRALGDGMPLDEWRDERAKVRAKEREREASAVMGER